MAGYTILATFGVFIVPQTVCTAEYFWSKELNSSQIFRKMCYLTQVAKNIHMKETRGI
jgi:hypothetical protein